MTDKFTPKKRIVRAKQFDGRNGKEFQQWSGLPGGRLDYRSYQHEMDLRFTNAAGNRYDSSLTQTMHPTDWLVIDGDEIYVLEDRLFQLFFEPKRSVGRPKKVQDHAPAMV